MVVHKQRIKWIILQYITNNGNQRRHFQLCKTFQETCHWIILNNYKISHTLTLDGSFADDAELADIVVTNNKVLATSVVVANSSTPCQIDVHTVVAGSFKVRVKNISGGAFSDDSTMIINYRVI